MKILLARTDAEHAMTLAEISAELAKYDIGAERKSLYDDLELLKLYGIDVQVKRDRRVRYYVAKHPFSLGELKLLTPEEILGETRLILQNCDCEGAVFRANHASNYLPLAGTLNRDRDRLIALIDSALAGKTNLRPEYFRAL